MALQAMTDTLPIHDLDHRTGWPEELRVLLQRHPRETWAEHGSPMAEFWLERHGHLRDHGRVFTTAGDAYRQNRCSPAELIAASAPQLQAFLANLAGHHQIEDLHYFPAFRAADSRLAPGFDVLARDHEQVHGDIVAIVERANQLITAVRDAGEAADRGRREADAYVEACETLIRRLARHLDDEEDLIIPLMLDHGR